MAMSLHSSRFEPVTLQMQRQGPIRLESPVDAGHALDSEANVCDFAGDGTASGAYNEAAFRYFLALERKRVARSNRPFLLLLLDLQALRANAAIEPDEAERLFATLAQYLRETDFVGWYHERRVIGAVLTQHAAVPGSDVWQVIAERVTRSVRDSLAADVAQRVQVRIFQLPPGMKSRS